MAEDWIGKQRTIWEQRLDRLESSIRGWRKKVGIRPRNAGHDRRK
jgi:hypothetical protein